MRAFFVQVPPRPGNSRRGRRHAP